MKRTSKWLLAASTLTYLINTQPMAMAKGFTDIVKFVKEKKLVVDSQEKWMILKGLANSPEIVSQLNTITLGKESTIASDEDWKRLQWIVENAPTVLGKLTPIRWTDALNWDRIQWLIEKKGLHKIENIQWNQLITNKDRLVWLLTHDEALLTPERINSLNWKQIINTWDTFQWFVQSWPYILQQLNDSNINTIDWQSLITDLNRLQFLAKNAPDTLKKIDSAHLQAIPWGNFITSWESFLWTIKNLSADVVKKIDFNTIPLPKLPGSEILKKLQNFKLIVEIAPTLLQKLMEKYQGQKVTFTEEDWAQINLLAQTAPEVLKDISTLVDFADKTTHQIKQIPQKAKNKLDQIKDKIKGLFPKKKEEPKETALP